MIGAMALVPLWDLNGMEENQLLCPFSKHWFGICSVSASGDGEQARSGPGSGAYSSVADW